MKVYHVQFLVGILIVRSSVERTVDISESTPIATKIIRHHVDGIDESAIIN